MNAVSRLRSIRGRLGAFAAALLCLALATPVVAEPIRANETLTLRIVEWQSASEQIRDWSAFAGDYMVDGQGFIALPFIGALQAEGLTEAELAQQVSLALSNRFALIEPVEAVIARSLQASVLVGGSVRTPGEVRMRTDMTARHAISLAGGTTFGFSSSVQARIETLTAQSQLAILQGRENMLLARLARLIAERDRAPSVQPPAGASAALDDLLRAEQVSLDLDRSRQVRELELVEGRIRMLEAEVAALDQKAVSLAEQRSMAESEREAIAALSDRGLTVNARVLDANRTLVTVETQILDVRTANLRAQQNLATAQSDKLELSDGAAARVLEQLRDTQSELDEVRARRAAQELILSVLSAEAGSDPNAGATVVVYRQNAGQTEVIRDALDLLLKPGDMVEVSPPLPLGKG